MTVDKQTLLNVGQLVYIAVKDLLDDDGPQWAAAIAYYTLLSSFPLLLAVAALAAYFVDPAWAVQQITSFLGRYLPTGQSELQEVARSAIEARGTIGTLSFITLLWSGSRVFGVVTKALNAAYDVKEDYGFVKRTLLRVIMLLTLGLVLVLALASPSLLRLAMDVLAILPGGGESLVAGLIRRLIPALLMLLAFFLIYYFVPRSKQSWQAALIGAVVAAALYLIARPLFLTYVGRFSNVNLIYGPIAALVVILLWTYVVALILLFGGELAFHSHKMLVQGQPDPRRLS